MSMLDRIVGSRRATDGNGHIAVEAGLVTDAAQLAAARPTPWQTVQTARNIARPHAMDIINRVFERFQELHGDRSFRDDPAIVGGIAELAGRPVMVVGQQKGSSTEENIHRNFGMPYPEGYRKGMRLYRLAQKFHLPLVTLVDTPGAYPGPEAEERGQAEAIASSIQLMTRLGVPVVVVVLGEGGSGGALALGVGDVVRALENATYSVISPEGCAAILWRSASEAERAAVAMKLAGPDLLETGVADALIREPAGGAHTADLPRHVEPERDRAAGDDGEPCREQPSDLVVPRPHARRQDQHVIRDCPLLSPLLAHVRGLPPAVPSHTMLSEQM